MRLNTLLAHLILFIPPAHGLHANGVLELRLQSGSALSSLGRLEDELAGVAGASAVLLVLEDGDGERDTELAASLSVGERLALLRREHAVRETLRSASVPVIGVAAGRHVDGAAAGLFLAASQRLVTEHTHIALTGCRLSVLPSGLSLLGASTSAAPDATRHSVRACATALAVGVAPLSAHDAASVLSARFAPAADVPALLHELRAAPRAYLDVPLTRRCEPAPAHLATLCTQLVPDALHKAFGAADSASEALVSVERERAAADALCRSCAWRTRELAEAVHDVLTAAALALHPQRCTPDPSAVAATYRVLRRCFDADAARAHAFELAVNTRLARRVYADSS